MAEGMASSVQTEGLVALADGRQVLVRMKAAMTKLHNEAGGEKERDVAAGAAVQKLEGVAD